MNKVLNACHASSEAPKVSHRNLRARFGTAFVSGCLALSLCPAAALAMQPGQDAPQGDTGANPPAMQQFEADGFDGNGFGNGFGGNGFGGLQAPEGPQGEAPANGEQPPALPNGEAQQGEAPDGQAPEGPQGQEPDGHAPDMQQGPFGDMPRIDPVGDQVKQILVDQFGITLPAMGEGVDGFQPGAPSDAPEIPEGEVNVQQVIDSTRDILREYGTEDLSTKLADPEFAATLQEYAKAMTEQRLAMFASNDRPSFDNPSDLPANPEDATPEGAPAEAPVDANADAGILSQIVDLLMDAFGYLA